MLLPGSWCFYYINNGAGDIHHGDMRLLIMSAPCIFTPFIKKRRRGSRRGRRRGKEEKGDGKKQRLRKSGGKRERGFGWKRTISVC